MKRLLYTVHLYFKDICYTQHHDFMFIVSFLLFCVRIKKTFVISNLTGNDIRRCLLFSRPEEFSNHYHRYHHHHYLTFGVVQRLVLLSFEELHQLYYRLLYFSQRFLYIFQALRYIHFHFRCIAHHCCHSLYTVLRHQYIRHRPLYTVLYLYPQCEYTYHHH